MMNKKGMTWEQIVLAIIAVVVVALIVIWFSRSGEKTYGQVDSKISGLSDCDKDGIANMFDKCPCDAEESKAEIKGCPASIKTDSDLTKYRQDVKACTCKT